MMVYTLWALLLVRSIFGGQTSRAVLLVLPLVLLAANRFPRVVLLAAIPAATFGNVVLPSWLSFRAYWLVVAIAGLGVVTRRWRLLPIFHGTVLILAVLIVGSAFTNEAVVGENSTRMLSLYTAVTLFAMASAALIKPQVEHVVLVIAVTGALVGGVVITGLFRTSDSSQSGPLLRVFALGLNPNSLGLIISLGVVAAIGIAIEQRTAWFGFFAIPGLLALPELKSRASLMVIIGGLFWLAFTAPGRRRERLMVISALMALLWLFRPSIGVDIYRAVLGARADVNLASGDQLRAGAARFAIDVGLDNPLIGVGFGQFPTVASGLFTLEPSAHNEFVRYFAELGVVGLGLLVAILIQVGRATRHSESRSATAEATLVLFTIAMLTIEPLQNLPTSIGVSILAGSVVGAGSLRFSEDELSNS